METSCWRRWSQPRNDQPIRTPWRWGTLQEALEAAIEAARADPDATRQMLAWLTIDCRTLDRFEEERA